MLISPTKKRIDDLQARLREIRSVSTPYTAPEIIEIEEEIKSLREQLVAEQVGGPAILKG